VTGPLLDIRPLTPDTWDALSGLFEEGADPSWCWCAFWRVRGRAGARAEKEQNRELLHGLAQREDVAPGLVALQDGRAVGWISLGPREDYERLSHSKVLAPIDDSPVWSIVCFVVSRPKRGKGIAQQLLRAGVEYAREHGATTLESYPVDASRGRVPAASANTGTVAMFERAGFRVATMRQANPQAQPRPIMRLELS
jgi:GNAT superfamily N-acetyltransferase